MLKKSIKSKIDIDTLILNIKQRFNISDKEIIELSKKHEIVLPISIFDSKLGILESACLHLKDELKLSFNEISRLLKRNYKTIWTSYNKGKNKIRQRDKVKNVIKKIINDDKEQIIIPISIFNDKLGMLESICMYLKNKLGLSFKEISEFLKRDYKTIWTSYNNAKNKLKELKP